MPVLRLSSQQISQLIEWIATYIGDQRADFLKLARRIPPDFVRTIQAFFPEDIIESVRVVRGRAAEPGFYSQLKALGIHNAPPFADMAGITFQDVVVHVDPLTPALLFHELVHTVQYKHLGLDGFAQYYVRGFLSGGSYEEIPLEKQAYELEERFIRNPSSVFSVEQDVEARIRKKQF
jgi:hypothetical protein